MAGPAEKQAGPVPPFKNARSSPPGTTILTRSAGNGRGGGAAKTPRSPSRPREISYSPQFVLKDRPALNGTEITEPASRTSTRPPTSRTSPSTSPTAGKTAFQDVTRTIAQRGNGDRAAGDVQLGRRRTSTRSTSRSCSTTRSSPARSSTSSTTRTGSTAATGAQISGNFDDQLGAGPGDDPPDRRPAGRSSRSSSQSTVSATLGPAGARPGPARRARRPDRGRPLPARSTTACSAPSPCWASVVYGVFFFALVKLIPITLTLPGIAGLILTIGVAADANIVIFERIKEEARAGRSMPVRDRPGLPQGHRDDRRRERDHPVHGVHPLRARDRGRQGVRVHARASARSSRCSPRCCSRRRSWARSGARGSCTRRARWAPARSGSRWHFDFSGASALVLLDLGDDPRDRRDLARHQAAQPRDRLHLGRQGHGEPPEVGDASTRFATRWRRPTSTTRRAPRSSRSTNDKLGPNVIEIQGKIPVGQVNGTRQERARRRASACTAATQGFQSTTVGPTFGAQVARSAVIAIIFSLLVISAYVAIRFEPKYAIPVIIALLHDILITAGVYSLTGQEVTSGTVAAFLTILGYSMYDTVIVFDRIRENVPRMPRAAFSQIANKSMSEVLTRSLITGLSTVFLITRALHLRRRDPQGLRLRDDGRGRCPAPTRRSSSPRPCSPTGRSASPPIAPAAGA